MSRVTAMSPLTCTFVANPLRSRTSTTVVPMRNRLVLEQMSMSSGNG